MVISAGLTSGISRPLTFGISDTGSGGFNALQVSGLRLWIDPSDSATVTSSSGSVSDILDKSGNASNLSQTTGASQPNIGAATLNGRSVLTFDGTADFMDFSKTPRNIMGNPSAGTLFLVQKVNTDPTTGTPSGILGTNSVSSVVTSWGTTATWDHIPWTSGNILIGWGSTARKDAGNPVSNLANWAIIEITTTATEYSVRINNNLFFTTATNTVGWSDSLTASFGLSRNTTFGSYYYAGQIAEVIAYDKAITADERALIFNGLSSKWGISEPFIPSLVPGLRLWIDPSDSATVTSSGGAVSAITDKSGNGNNLTQTTGANQPFINVNTLNGRSVLTSSGFPQVLDFAVTPRTIMGNPSAGRMFVVKKLDADPAGSNAVAGSVVSNVNGPGIEHIPFTDGNVYTGWGSSTRQNCGNPALSFTSWRIFEVVTSATEFSVLIDNTVFFTTATNTVSWPNTANEKLLGSSIYGVDGDVAEVLCYNSALTSDQRTSVYNYLKSKWGL
jgi:hypothetical protein